MASVRDLELARLRAMTASEKVSVMHALWRQGWSLVVAGVRGRASNYVYGSAKAQVQAFLSGLRQRLAPRGIAVVDIRPGG